MMNKDKILAALDSAKGWTCDDCLTRHAGLKQRQTAYQICTQLSRDGVLERERETCARCRGFKLVSRIGLAAPEVEVTSAGRAETVEATSNPASPWYWEGNVQSTLVAWLTANGYSIRTVADTASKAAGKEIIAVDGDGIEWWISVKGYPNGTERTQAPTQARHWFSGALLDLILYRGERADVALAAAFPDGFKTYQSLAERSRWLKSATPFTLFWVGSDGRVRQQ